MSPMTAMMASLLGQGPNSSPQRKWPAEQMSASSLKGSEPISQYQAVGKPDSAVTMCSQRGRSAGDESMSRRISIMTAADAPASTTPA